MTKCGHLTMKMTWTVLNRLINHLCTLGVSAGTDLISQILEGDPAEAQADSGSDSDSQACFSDDEDIVTMRPSSPAAMTSLYRKSLLESRMRATRKLCRWYVTSRFYRLILRQQIQFVRMSILRFYGHHGTALS